jgi:excisionase family DNA binding protein
MSKTNAPEASVISLLFPEEAMIVLTKSIEDRILSTFKGNPELISSLIPAPVAKDGSKEDPNFIYFTTEEVAKRLRCSVSTVRSLCKSKKLGSSKPAGKDILISKAQLELYLTNQTLAVA